jgi:LmbE family N-acetylglucosaminyl deacetylase
MPNGLAPRRLLVVAAHPDDDTIGCGGLIARVARTSPVTVVYVSDGSRSHPGSRAFPPERIAALRESEACDALRELGVAQAPVFLRFPDGELATLDPVRRSAAEARIAETISAVEPDTILAPWLRDPHPDHAAAAHLALAAAVDLNFAGAFGFYEVWLSVRGTEHDHPQPGETHATISELDADACARKRRALYAHRSQITDLVDDDPGGFRITPELAASWLGPHERFFWRVASGESGGAANETSPH